MNPSQLNMKMFNLPNVHSILLIQLAFLLPSQYLRPMAQKHSDSRATEASEMD